MKNKNYKAYRDNIFVGEVVRTDSIYRYEGTDGFWGMHTGRLMIRGWHPYRSMLFAADEQGLSQDLLYQSPKYPILNIADDESLLGINSATIIIKDACNLSKLLGYFNYGEELTLSDLRAIRQSFFTGRFAKDNCQLFGWKEDQPEDWTYYEYDKQVTDSKRLKELIEQKRKEQAAGHRSFGKVEKGILPEEYWNILDRLGNKPFWECLEDGMSGLGFKPDPFAPDKEEGPIKKISLF